MQRVSSQRSGSVTLLLVSITVVTVLWTPKHNLERKVGGGVKSGTRRLYTLRGGLGQHGSKAECDSISFSAKRKGPYVIGVAGGTASGKTTVCETIIKKIGLSPVVMLPMDRFYRKLSKQEIDNIQNHNFDHPDAFDWKLFRSTLEGLVSGKNVQVPRYDFKTHSRENQTDSYGAADVIIVEGILVLYDKAIRNAMDLKIFVDTDADVRLARRIRRDVTSRGRTVDEILDQYCRTVKQSYDDFIHPTKRHADLVIPQGGSNTVAIKLMVEHVMTQLNERGIETNSTKDDEDLGEPKSHLSPLY